MELYSILMDFSPTFYGLPKPILVSFDGILLSYFSTIVLTSYVLQCLMFLLCLVALHAGD